MGKLKDDSNFQIYGWMATKLKLKGNELLIYAIIYSAMITVTAYLMPALLIFASGQDWHERM